MWKLRKLTIVDIRTGWWLLAAGVGGLREIGELVFSLFFVGVQINLIFKKKSAQRLCIP